jgi:hypothetical protein
MQREPITLRGILSVPKLAAEGGTPAELQIVLGWMMDTHLILIQLPCDKYEAWALELGTIRHQRAMAFEELDSLVGKLNHAAYLIPLARHFLTRFRKRIGRDHPPRQQLKIPRQVGQDAELWELLLPKASLGISMNRLTIRQLT